MYETFLRNRRALARLLKDGPILLAGSNPVARNHDVEYPFRQKSDFLYLTGVEEPGCQLLIDPLRKSQVLFLPRIDSHHRVWLGHVPGPEEAAESFKFKRARYSDDLAAEILKARRGARKCYVDQVSAKKFKNELKGLRNAPDELQDALEELRAVKTAGELALMGRANRISAAAHLEVMRSVRPGMFEHQAQAIFDSHCLKEGIRHLAYPTIVAAGRNAAVLHYHRNNSKINDGDLLLIDAGAEMLGYAADITRTFPANGRFSRRQRDIYSIVLETQKAAIERSRPPIVSAELHVFSMTKIAEGLKELGILKGDVSGLVEGGAVRLFYPHGLTHMLGLDVHDVTGGRRRVLPNPTKVPVRFIARLEPGFVITMEPGIYFIEALLHDPELRRKHKGSVDFDKAEKFLDFGGVRIEDDIIIQSDGPPLNLTAVPKEMAQIEEACRR